MIRSALITGVLALTLGSATVFAQDAPPQSTQSEQDQDHAQTAPRHKAHHHNQQANRDRGHSKATDQIADRLNACESKPEDQRQSCLQDAAKGG